MRVFQIKVSGLAKARTVLVLSMIFVGGAIYSVVTSLVLFGLRIHVTPQIFGIPWWLWIFLCYLSILAFCELIMVEDATTKTLTHFWVSLMVIFGIAIFVTFVCAALTSWTAAANCLSYLANQAKEWLSQNIHFPPR